MFVSTWSGTLPDMAAHQDRLAQADHAGGHVAGSKVGIFLWAGIVGPPLFCVVFLVEGVVHPEYNAWRDYVSDLSLGPQGWVQMANFVVFGLLMLAYAVGLRRALSTGKASVAGPILFGLIGAAAVLAGIFVTDPGTQEPVTAHGLVHNLVSTVAFGCIAIVCFVFARRYAAETGWGGFAAYSLASGVGLPVVLVATGVVPVGWAGLVQRIAIGVGFLWITFAAWRLVRRQARLANTATAT